MNKEIEVREDELEEWNAQEGLKIYLNRVLSLRPAKNLSPLSIFIFKLGVEILDAIGEDAGHICDRERYLKYLYWLKLKNNSAEVAKVLDIVLEGVEWIKEDSTLWEWESDEHKSGIPHTLQGAEVFCTFDLAMLTDEEMKTYQYPEVLTNLKSIGVDLKEEIEDTKWHPASQEKLDKLNKTEEERIEKRGPLVPYLKKLAKEAGSDFFDNITDETFNDIMETCDFLEDDFKEYLDSEKGLKEQVRVICPDTFSKKWKLFLKVYIQMEEQTSTRNVNIEIIKQLLPFVSNMRFAWDTLEIKVDVFDPKLIYLFGNLGADQYGEEEGWFTAWWD